MDNRLNFYTIRVCIDAQPEVRFYPAHSDKAFNPENFHVSSILPCRSFINKINSYRRIASLTAYEFKRFKVQWTFVWHKHPDTDEAFMAVEGRFDIELRDKILNLAEGGGSQKMWRTGPCVSHCATSCSSTPKER